MQEDSKIAHRLFWQFVNKGGEGGCWEWTGLQHPSGYASAPTSKCAQMHRLIYYALVGDIPKGMFVRHLCGNRICVNPKHLAVGTPAQNSFDRIAHGTSLRGELHPRAKLTSAQALSIRKEHADGCATNALSEKYGVTRSAIRWIVTGMGWKNIDMGDVIKRRKREKLNSEAVKVIRWAYENKAPVSKLASLYGVTQSSIYQVIRGERWGQAALNV